MKVVLDVHKIALLVDPSEGVAAVAAVLLPSHGRAMIAK